jgi:hypothetical protein
MEEKWKGQMFHYSGSVMEGIRRPDVNLSDPTLLQEMPNVHCRAAGKACQKQGYISQIFDLDDIFT